MFIVVYIRYIFFFMFFGFYNKVGRRTIKCWGYRSVDNLNLTDPVLKNWKSLSLVSRTFCFSNNFIKLKYNCFFNHVPFVERVYEILLDPDFIYFSYTQLKSFSKSVRGIFDLSSLEYEIVIDIVNSLKYSYFGFGQTNNDRTNKFYLLYFKNKIIQQSIFFILETIYEPIFFKNSFGFRKLFNPHDCLYYISKEFNNMSWFISGTIKKCFCEIDQAIFLGFLKKKVRDEKFLELVSNFLKVGYLNSMKPLKDSFIGNVNGSVLSGMLVNIFLHEFDNYFIGVLFDWHNKYTYLKDKDNNCRFYDELRVELYYNVRKYRLTRSNFYSDKFNDLRLSMLKYNQNLKKFGNLRQISYVRYADDWLISLNCFYTDALNLRDLSIAFFSKMKCRFSLLNIRLTPTCRGSFFMGFHVSIVREKYFLKKRREFSQVLFKIPIKRVLDKLVCNKFLIRDKGGRYKSIPYLEWYSYSRLNLLNSYNLIFKFFVNFYLPAINIKKFIVLLWYLLRSSMAKLIACKYKLKSTSSVFKKYGRFLEKFVLKNGFISDLRFIDWHDEIILRSNFKFKKTKLLSTRFLRFSTM